jgi:hypothetical protein
MPAGTPPQLLHAMHVLAPLTITLWITGAAGTWVPWRLVPLVRDGAVVTLIIAAMCCCTAIVVDKVDGTLVTLVCELARRRVQDSRQHLQAAGSAQSRSR